MVDETGIVSPARDPPSCALVRALVLARLRGFVVGKRDFAIFWPC
jgi:hypothetical protein